MPPRSVATLRWRRVALAAALLVIGAGLVLLAPVLHRGTATQLSAEPALPDNRLDLRDWETRRYLERLTSGQRGRYADLAPPLFWRCMEGTSDVVAVAFQFSFEASYYVELRRGTGTEASALVWKNLGWGVPPPPPRSAQGYFVPPPESAGTPQPRAVPDAEFAEIIGEFVELSARDVAPLHGKSGLDGGVVLIETCHQGRYGVFLRENIHNDDDVRVMALAERVLIAADVHERQQQYEAPPGPVAL